MQSHIPLRFPEMYPPPFNVVPWFTLTKGEGILPGTGAASAVTNQ